MAVLAGSTRWLRGGDDDPVRELDWQDAVVALAAAVTERGGTLVAPANVGLVDLLAQVAMPHSRPQPAEAFHERTPIEAMETAGYSLASRRLLAPFAHRSTVTLVDQNHVRLPLTELPLPGEEDAGLLRDAAHHPFHPALLDDALGAVVIHPHERMFEEMLQLRQQTPGHLAVFGGEDLPAGLDGWARENDPTPRLLDGLTDPDAVAGSTPYSLVMELLVDDWLGPTGG